MLSTAVLYTDNFKSQTYHIMTQGKVYRDVLRMDRTKKGYAYIELYNWMRYTNAYIDRLWVHGDNEFSLWAMRSDFDSIPIGKNNIQWFAPKPLRGGHPTGIQIHDSMDVYKWIFFPQHMDLIRNHKPASEDWLMPSPDILLDTVCYIEAVTGIPFMWSAGYSSAELLRQYHRQYHPHKVFKPFEPTELWTEVTHNAVQRTQWSYRKRNKQKGLEDFQKQYTYLHGFDKNMQYLAACVGLELPIGQYKIVDGNAFVPDARKLQGMWKYTIKDVSKSMFNSFECYCPLKISGSWASTSVLAWAIASGIEVNIEMGVVWPYNAMGGRLLDSWAHRIYGARQSLKDTRNYPDVLASFNAQETMKKFYVDMIGRFMRDYNKEYYQPQWNELIIQESIARQMFALYIRAKEIQGKLVLVVNDAFYLLSNEPDIHKAYPSLLTYEHDLRGFKPVGTVELDQHLIHAFETMRPLDIELQVKERINNAR